MKVQAIVIHHSASSFNTSIQALKNNCLHWLSEDRRRYWISKGYVADYHYFITSNGEIYTGQPETMVAFHCGDDYWNEHSLAVCCVGNLETSKMPDKMLNALVKQVSILEMKYKCIIKLHREIVNTACPGRFFRYQEFLKKLGENNMDNVQFKDVDPKRWSYNAIKKVASLGIMRGDEKGFRPQSFVTREELAQVIYNLLDYFGGKEGI